jgi:hypothetical protein
VKWVTPTILKVNREVFGWLINVTRPAAALYNNQGSFATHGFREVSFKSVEESIAPEDRVDIEESIVRLFKHVTPMFNVFFTDAHLRCCRYAPSGL